MTTSSDAEDISQRLLGRIQAEYPTLIPQMGQMITDLGRNSESVDKFRKQLNQTLRWYLTNLQTNSIDIRILLDDDDNMEYWYRNLTTIVLPFCRDSK